MPHPFRGRPVPEPARDRRTLVFLIGALLVLGALMLYFVQTSTQREPHQEAHREENDWVGTPLQWSYTPIALDPDLASRILESTESDRAIKESEPYVFLLNSLAERSFAYLKHLGFRRVPGDLLAAELIQHPQDHRAELVRAKGTVREIGAKRMDRPGVYVREVVDGVIELHETDASGAPVLVAFECVEPVSADLDVGDVAEVFGVFFKAYAFRVPGEEPPRWVTGPLLLAKEVHKTYHYLDVKELDPAIARLGRDSTSEEMIQLEREPYHHVLSYLKQLPEEEAREMDAAAVTARELRLAPDLFRAKWIKLRGRLDIVVRREMPDNPSGLDHYYYAHMRTDEEPARVHFVDSPHGVAVGDMVYVTGIFLKNYAYEPVGSDELNPKLRRLPLVIGKTITRIRIRENALETLNKIVLGVAAVLAIAFAALLLRDRRKSREFQTEERERHKRRRERLGDLDAAARRAIADARGDPARPAPSEESPSGA